MVAGPTNWRAGVLDRRVHISILFHLRPIPIRSISMLLITLVQQLRIRVTQEHLNVLHSRGAVREKSFERRAKRIISEIILGILLSRAIEPVEKGGDIENLRSILHKVLLDDLPLGERAAAGGFLIR